MSTVSGRNPNITKRERQILEGLRKADKDACSDVDLVLDGNLVYFGLERTSEWGRRVLDDPEFDPELELVRLMMKAEQAGLECNQ